VTRLRDGGPKNRGSIPERGKRFLYCPHGSDRLCCGAHPALYPARIWGSIPTVKRTGPEGDHSLQSSAEVKNASSYPA
jgi:hypothetical protein